EPQTRGEAFAGALAAVGEREALSPGQLSDDVGHEDFAAGRQPGDTRGHDHARSKNVVVFRDRFASVHPDPYAQHGVSVLVRNGGHEAERTPKRPRRRRKNWPGTRLPAS